MTSECTCCRAKTKVARMRCDACHGDLCGACITRTAECASCGDAVCAACAPGAREQFTCRACMHEARHR
jgi:hypothetical protein